MEAMRVRLSFFVLFYVSLLACNCLYRHQSKYTNNRNSPSQLRPQELMKHAIQGDLDSPYGKASFGCHAYVYND